MDDELDLNLDNTEEIISRKDKRLLKLREDIKERDEKLAQEAEARKKAEEERANALKESEFYKGFNQVSTKYQGANEYQDKIWEKVRSGYDIEDATVAVLNKEGKFTPTAPEVEKETVAGGSAVNVLAGSGEKTLAEMTKEEKRAQLEEAFNKGEISF